MTVHPDLTANLALSNPTGGGALGLLNTAVLTLTTDDPKIQFSSAAYSVAESSSKATVTVKRTGPTAQAVVGPQRRHRRRRSPRSRQE